MDVKIDSLIPFDTLRTDLEHVFSIVEKNGKVVLLKDNKPVYVVLKYDAELINGTNTVEKHNYYTLQEAMKIVLSRLITKQCTHQSWPIKYMNADYIYEKMGRRRNIRKLGLDVVIIQICLKRYLETILN